MEESFDHIIEQLRGIKMSGQLQISETRNRKMSLSVVDLAADTKHSQITQLYGCPPNIKLTIALNRQKK